MKNEIKIRKKRFLAILLVMLIVLKSLPPISVRAEAVYDLAELYEMSEYPVLNPGDTLSNSGETSCVISYYDYGEYGEELISNRIDQGMSHTVFDYPGNLPDGVEFSGWLISYIYASGGVIESVNLEATITIQGTEISDSLYNTILDAETVLYHGTDSYTISYYNQDGSELGEMVQIDANIPYKVIDYPSTIPEGSTFAGWQVSYIYVSGGSGTLNLTAQFELKQYTIKFVNENGEELKRCELTYGEIPTYSGKTPVKEATAPFYASTASFCAEDHDC